MIAQALVLSETHIDGLSLVSEGERTYERLTASRAISTSNSQSRKFELSPGGSRKVIPVRQISVELESVNREIVRALR